MRSLITILLMSLLILSCGNIEEEIEKYENVKTYL